MTFKMWSLSLGLAALAGTASAADMYRLKHTLAVPPSADNVLEGAFATFDIGAFDGVSQVYYLSDRSNAALDVFSAKSDSFLGRIGGTGHLFTGQMATNGLSGPDGLLVIDQGGQHQVFAGNADSSVMGFDLPLRDGAAAAVRVATGAADQNRVDEISYDPQTRLILAGNNATGVNFASLIDVDPGSTGFRTVRHRFVFDGENGVPLGKGLEASAYDAVTHSFFLAVQHLGSDPASPGGLVEIDPAAGRVVRVMDFATERFGHLAKCAPSGVSVATSGRIIVGCAVASQSFVIDPAGEGRITAMLPEVSGVDEIAYDPATDRWFLAARDNPGGPVLGVVDAARGVVMQLLPTSFNAHSVAVDPVSGKVFVPEGAHATNTTCPKGCIAVFEKVDGAELDKKRLD